MLAALVVGFLLVVVLGGGCDTQTNKDGGHVEFFDICLASWDIEGGQKSYHIGGQAQCHEKRVE